MTGPRAALVAACRALAAAGLSPGSSGNASVRTGGTVHVTAGGSSFATLRPRDVVRLEGGAPGASGRLGGRPPTKEAAMHQAVYRARPEAGAVVHLHSPSATALSCLPAGPGDPLPAFTPYRIRLLGAVALVGYAPPGSGALADLVEQAARGSWALLLAHHGLVVAGRDLDAASAAAAEFEAACALALVLRGTEARPLDPATAWADAGR